MGNSTITSHESPENFYSELSDSDLYLCFCRNNWVALNESDRLLLLNAVLNKENMKYGGNYAVHITFENMKSNIAGYQNGDRIFLNREMFVNDRLIEVYGDKSIEFKLSDSNWQALETALHENRHVFQDKVVEGVVKYNEYNENIFASNGFTVSIVDGQRASQYMLGETSYALYYLNPTEMDAYKTSQERTQQIINALSKQGMRDVSADKYISNLQATGYKTKLEEFKKEFNNVNVEKEVAQVLKNTYFNMNAPVNKTIESAVKQEMIKSQAVIDNQIGTEAYSMANKEYSENGFTYTVDEGGTITAEGKVPTQGIKCGSRVTPEGMLPGDQRGHLIAAQEGGPNKSFNMTAQDGKLNQGAYKAVENTEVDLARHGYEVHTSKTAYVSTQQGGRPDAYMISDTITTPSGKMQSVHLSFQNMVLEEQEAQNKTIHEMNVCDNFPNPDPLRDSMSNEEYNSLIAKTEPYLPSVKEEFDMSNTTAMLFNEDCIHEANASFEGESTLNDSSVSDVCNDGGQGTGGNAETDGGCSAEM